MILAIALFVVLLIVTLICVGLGQAVLVSRQKQQIRNMLKRAEPVSNKRGSNLLKPEASEDPLEKLIQQIPLLQRLALHIAQAGGDWSMLQYVVMTAAAAIAGAFIGFVIPPFSLVALSPFFLAVLFGLVPLMIVSRKRSKRLAAFEEQFPEALNFLSRSMRAGHGFTIGLEMLVADAPEPLRSCFRVVLSDLQLGSTLESSLGKLAVIAPLIDVRFFISSVLLQQGSGGNLGEILDSMAQIIRERFRLKGQVKAASAHGRVTGLILSLMPVVVAAIMFFTSPAYLFVLFQDPLGKKLLTAAACGQVVGYLIIRKIVSFKV
jgi:tight adherence protein B